jgi:hypothetical protein
MAVAPGGASTIGRPAPMSAAMDAGKSSGLRRLKFADQRAPKRSTGQRGCRPVGTVEVLCQAAIRRQAGSGLATLSLSAMLRTGTPRALCGLPVSSTTTSSGAPGPGGRSCGRLERRGPSVYVCVGVGRTCAVAHSRTTPSRRATGRRRLPAAVRPPYAAGVPAGPCGRQPAGMTSSIAISACLALQ